MKMNGIRKYSGYIMIAVVVVFLSILLCYVNYNSLSSKESFVDPSGNTMGTPDWKKSYYINNNKQVIDKDTGNALPNLTATFKHITFKVPGVTLNFYNPIKKESKEQKFYVFNKQFIEKETGMVIPDVEASYTNTDSGHTLNIRPKL